MLKKSSKTWKNFVCISFRSYKGRNFTYDNALYRSYYIFITIYFFTSAPLNALSLCLMRNWSAPIRIENLAHTHRLFYFAAFTLGLQQKSAILSFKNLRGNYLRKLWCNFRFLQAYKCNNDRISIKIYSFSSQVRSLKLFCPKIELLKMYNHIFKNTFFKM